MNILFLTIDQHRWDFVEGGTVAGLRTPTMAGLRAAGTTFTNGISNCPICMPTRFTWMHGLYASQANAGLLANAADWPLDLPTLPQALQRAGYHTALVGKLHRHAGLVRRDLVADAAGTLGLGFDEAFEVSGKSLALWDDCEWTQYLRERGLWERYVADVAERGDEFGLAKIADPSVLAEEDSMDGFIARQAVEWLERYDGGKPFFLHASLCGPHFPVDPPERFFERYAADEMPLPEGVDDPVKVAEWRRRRAGYAALVEHVDHEMGRVLAALEGRGWVEDTLVVFGSDHGEMIGHRDRANKNTPYETSIRTPVTFRLPGRIAAGRVVGDLLEAVDLPVTMAAAAGLSVEAAGLRNSPGRSAWERLVGRSETAVREFGYSEGGLGNGAWRVLRSARHKFIARANEADEFYDLRDDPWELDNRADDPECAVIQDELRGELVRTMMRHAIAPEREPRRERDDWWRGAIAAGGE